MDAASGQPKVPLYTRRRWLERAGAAASAVSACASGAEPAKLASDPHRPQYHFLSPANYLNDPNGPLYWHGKNHLFYQYNPNAPVSATKHWGHAVSPDLLHWRHLPIAMAPTPGGPDKDGVFTGSIVVDRGVPTAVFTGVRPEVQMIATAADPELVRWNKYPGNPVVASPPAGLEVTGFRDPCAWNEHGQWYIAVGSGIKGQGGAALLYRSADLRSWEYLHPLYVGRAETDGTMWNCPDFFPLGGKYVLGVAIGGAMRYGATPYFVGSYVNQRFEPESRFDGDFGSSYAPKTMLHPSGRRISFTWLREKRSRDAQIAAGWSGVMSLPRVLTLEGGRFGIEPASEVAKLRGAKVRFSNIAMPPGETELPRAVPGDGIEIAAEIDAGEAQEVGITFRESADGREWARVTWDRSSGTLSCDTTHSSLSSAVTGRVEQARFDLDARERLKLRLFLDASAVEIFANGRAAIGDRVYPTQADATKVKLYTRGGAATAREIQVWRINPISKDRLTT